MGLGIVRAWLKELHDWVPPPVVEQPPGGSGESNVSPVDGPDGSNGVHPHDGADVRLGLRK